MGSRTVLAVIAMSSVVLVAAVSLQSAGAQDGATSQPWIDQIDSITAEAKAGIHATVAPVEATLRAAATNEEAKRIRDAAKNAVRDIYELAKDDIDEVVDNSLDAPAVKEAADAAKREVGDNELAAEDEIKALYDEWKFRFDAPPASEVIADLDKDLAEGLDKIAGVVEDYAHELGSADDLKKAIEERGEALEKLVEKVAQAMQHLADELAKRPFDPIVQDAYAADVSQLLAAEVATERLIAAMHEDWVAEHVPTTTTTTTVAVTTVTTSPKATTTTTIAPTTTTIAPTTTTIAPTTTTTTLPAAAQLPSTEPPPPTDMAYLADPPATQVMAESVSASSAEMTGSDMATVSFVRRVVDTQFPAGVSTVAAGPLVVLGLIVDAVVAAGSLMLAPWVLLGIYMVGLLRGKIPLESKL